MIKGIHYRSRLFYNTQTLIKLGPAWQHRFRLAAAHIPEGVSVLDVCAGPGDLSRHLPPGCRYTALDASPGFVRHLSAHNIPCLVYDLSSPLDEIDGHYDVAVMIISLCHFSQMRAQSLLRELTRLADKIVIVEEVTENIRPAASRLQRTMNYLTTTDYTTSYSILSAEEFKRIVKAAGYLYQRADRRYAVGVFER